MIKTIIITLSIPVWLPILLIWLIILEFYDFFMVIYYANRSIIKLRYFKPSIYNAGFSLSLRLLASLSKKKLSDFIIVRYYHVINPVIDHSTDINVIKRLLVNYQESIIENFRCELNLDFLRQINLSDFGLQFLKTIPNDVVLWKMSENIYSIKYMKNLNSDQIDQYCTIPIHLINPKHTKQNLGIAIYDSLISNYYHHLTADNLIVMKNIIKELDIQNHSVNGQTLNRWIMYHKNYISVENILLKKMNNKI